ncbi:hypothetical protein N8I74_03355 [Chitiniphilus purpureus]|uniref:Uncharacterized protein n=1 Tax=Chitiniphilus purpureus TaxID=2981137 RepID=A0ABY6DNW2_9NEIS|nr:hypothetical protein [Chitiniphilus sp. CD1]UXY16074.1 hypothetical protein N8I74_03355 [Chitiniphilus sp. CD1]
MHHAYDELMCHVFGMNRNNAGAALKEKEPCLLASESVAETNPPANQLDQNGLQAFFIAAKSCQRGIFNIRTQENFHVNTNESDEAAAIV